MVFDRQNIILDSCSIYLFLLIVGINEVIRNRIKFHLQFIGTVLRIPMVSIDPREWEKQQFSQILGVSFFVLWNNKLCNNPMVLF